ncbi:hypothetical protein [Dyella sp. GSA-30]|uniref:hypothetical protein n=1 Tax=Dyella sp. GSA-30 TaxID=2994496 RepID=UPI002492D123|nr:hypothetical protein [Dyella sp. GSA-30]
MLAMALSPAAWADEEKYVDAIHYPDNEEGWSRFYDLAERLTRDFDAVCGDTFCESDYSNIQSLRLRCSVERATGVMGECIWTFAGSYEDVDPVNGRVQVDARVWNCKAPLAAGTSIEHFYAALEGSHLMDAIDAPLPGTKLSLYDGLTDCL